MLRTKMMLLTVLVAALAVPSLWAQKKHKKMPESQPSVKKIQQELQSKANTAAVSAVCTGLAGGLAPAGYLAGTNKCSSSSPLYGFGDSINTTVGTCSDKGGVEGTYAAGMNVAQAGVPGALFSSWGGPFNVGGTEYSTPDIYFPAISPNPDVNITLKRNEGVFGLEVDNTTEQTNDVTFHTTAGDVALPGTLVGGLAEPFSQAQRFIGICNAAAITGVTLHCADCTDLSGPTAFAQVRGDKFP